MPFKIVRNDITKMETEAIVNTANEAPTVGSGCDYAIYKAAGFTQLLAYRRKKIGRVPEGEVFITPGFSLPANYIIHAVSPHYEDGRHGEEALLRSCYRKSLLLAAEYGIRSVAIPLISTGGFGYPKEEGMRIAVDEIHAFLLHAKMQIYLVVFDDAATGMGRNLYPDLKAYIDRHYVEERSGEEYTNFYNRPRASYSAPEHTADVLGSPEKALYDAKPRRSAESGRWRIPIGNARKQERLEDREEAVERLEKKLAERMRHLSDTFPQYLLYLIEQKGMENAEVYKRAIVDKKVFSKIKNNPDYHPQKLTALCLCVGAKLSLDETKDLLARAGYALSPCDKTDVIFSYFIENEIYDMIELDIQLEEYGLPCIIS